MRFYIILGVQRVLIFLNIMETLMIKSSSHIFIYINFDDYPILRQSLDNAVGIATGYWLDDRRVGVRVPVESRISSSPRRPDRL
jgi:hypothetical protein